jgi:hypothetical protein
VPILARYSRRAPPKRTILRSRVRRVLPASNRQRRAPRPPRDADDRAQMRAGEPPPARARGLRSHVLPVEGSGLVRSTR